jgi:hypothetical protein
LSKFQHPDLSGFDDPEVCFRVPLDYHAGLIVKSNKKDKIMSLLENYTARLVQDFATVAAQDKVKNLH